MLPRNLQTKSHLLKKSLMENFIFCAVLWPTILLVFFFQSSIKSIESASELLLGESNLMICSVGVPRSVFSTSEVKMFFPKSYFKVV